MKKRSRVPKKQGTRGPAPEHLALEGDWKGAVKRALEKGKPPALRRIAFLAQPRSFTGALPPTTGSAFARAAIDGTKYVAVDRVEGTFA